ncbi:MAG: hypothetical protein JW959_08340 [Pirellulales bacterium]|nr:hypothetical protein [Pirellulales bacterium]
MENRDLADQLDAAALNPGPSPKGRGEIFDSSRSTVVREEAVHPALRLLRARPELFAVQGYIAASWRRRGGKKFGPYYRLCYREGGRQHSIYLGRDGALVERVRRELSAAQMPLIQRRVFHALQRQVRASLRVHKRRVSDLLRPYGLWLKGCEVRGWRFSPLRTLFPRRRLSFRGRLRSPIITCQEAQLRMMRYLAARDGPSNSL